MGIGVPYIPYRRGVNYFLVKPDTSSDSFL